MAIQAAKRLDAGVIVAAGRNPQSLASLPSLGADIIISLEQSDGALAEAFAREGPFDVVVDYLWGRPTEVLLQSLEKRQFELRSERVRHHGGARSRRGTSHHG
jgi:threonine dehydrogenase-like Zn-dependent dehydrogenase